MKTSQMLKVIPIATLALLMSCSGSKREDGEGSGSDARRTGTYRYESKGESGDGLCSRRGATQ